MSPPRFGKLRWVGVGIGPHRAATGIGDLLRVLDQHGSDELPTVARLLGYRYTEPEKKPPEDRRPPGGDVDEIYIDITEGDPIHPPVRRGPGEMDPATFVRLIHREDKQPDHHQARDFGPPLKLSDVTGTNRGRVVSEVEGPPLARWSRIGAHLRHVVGGHCDGREVDVDALVRCWSRGTLVRRIPCRKRRVWPERVIVVVDRSPRLIPFWSDQQRVVSHLRKELGRLRVVEHLQDNGPFSTTFEVRGNRSVPLVYSRGGGPIIALTDLGHYADDGGRTRRTWARYAREAVQAGHRLTSLVPVPPSRWEPALTRPWGAFAWERTARGSDHRSVAREQAGARRVLELLSLTSRVEPGLLREVRQLMPGTDVGTEADAWNHPDVYGGSPLGLSFRNATAQAGLREGFTHHPEALRKAVVERILAYHSGLVREVLGEDILNARILQPSAETESAWTKTRERILAIAAMLRGKVVDTDLRKGYLNWLAGFVPRLADGVWDDAEVGDALVQCLAELRREHFVRLPKSLRPRKLAEYEEKPRTPQTWYLGQTGNFLALAPTAPIWPVRPTFPRSVIAPVTSASLDVTLDTNGTIQTARLDPGSTVRVPMGGLRPGEKIVVRTDNSTLTLATLKPPGWAAKMGRDAFGLWASIKVGRVTATMRWIPPGSFMMGSPEDEPGRFDDEGPQHRVELTQGYWLMETPCTQALWEEVMGSNPSSFKGAEHPVENVDWNQAEAFCEKLQSRMPGSGEEVFQLPTEAQWEYACRAGTTTPTYAGGSARKQLDGIAWYGGNSEGRAHSVRGKVPNSWGLYDTLGNVWEWCGDWFAAYTAATALNPRGPAEGTLRVIRGGSWNAGASDVRAAYRLWGTPGRRDDSLGFRLARGPAPGRS